MTPINPSSFVREPDVSASVASSIKPATIVTKPQPLLKASACPPDVEPSSIEAVTTITRVQVGSPRLTKMLANMPDGAKVAVGDFDPQRPAAWV